MKTTSTFILLALTITGRSAWADDKWDVSKLDVSKLPSVVQTQGVTYAKDVRPLLEAACFRCHGEEKQKGDLRLDSLEAVLRGGEDGKIVVPGESKKSLLVAAIAQLNDEIAMPPKRKPGGPGGPGGPPPGAPRGEGGPDNRPPGGGSPPPGGQGGPGGRGGFGPPAKPLTPEQIGLIRAWIDQGAK